jgi:L-rhamnose-H+ transport protein
MTLGMSFAFIGLSLAYSLNYGAQIIFGAVAPMVLHHPDRILTAQGMVVLSGVAVCVAGVVLSGLAGILKDRTLKTAAPGEVPAAEAKKPRMLIGLVLAVASGVLCACYGLAASCTGPLAEVARQHLADDSLRVSVVTTAVILWGGAVSSCLYCAVLLTRNGTWKQFAAPGAGRAVGIALLMAFLHNGAIYLFNLGFPMLGDLGVSVGYAAFMSFAIIVGNVHGFRTGEWRGAGLLSIGGIVAGILTLILGVCMLAVGNTMGPK